MRGNGETAGRVEVDVGRGEGCILGRVGKRSIGGGALRIPDDPVHLLALLLLLFLLLFKWPLWPPFPQIQLFWAQISTFHRIHTFSARYIRHCLPRLRLLRRRRLLRLLWYWN